MNNGSAYLVGAVSTDRLQRLIAHVRDGGPPDPELYSWISVGAAERRAGVDFEIALGLRGNGAVRERNKALVAAADSIDPYHDLSRWARAGKLAKHVERFEVKMLQRCRDANATPAGFLNKCLFRAWQTGQRVPKTQRALNDVLKNAE